MKPALNSIEFTMNLQRDRAGDNLDPIATATSRQN